MTIDDGRAPEPLDPRAPDELGTDALAQALLALRDEALDLERSCRDLIDGVPEADRPSARNLVHYLAVRRRDHRRLQRALAARGLSSLGRAEAHVLATIDAVLGNLGVAAPDVTTTASTFASGAAALARRAHAALGPVSDRGTRLMVTLPSEAASDPSIAADLVAAGMDLARINCAHDDPEAWRQMAQHVRAAAAAARRPVRVAFDLAGPKLRTGSVGEDPRVLRVKPRRAADGSVQRPALVRFAAGTDAEVAGDGTAVVPIGGSLANDAQVGDEVVLRDARGRRRRISITRVDDGAIEGLLERTAYFAAGALLALRRDGRAVGEDAVGDLPAVGAHIEVGRGEVLRIRRGSEPGRPATIDERGAVVEPASVACELEAIFDAVAPGHRVLLDDGAIDGVVERTGDDWFDVVVHRPRRAKIKSEKGINLPDTAIESPALTADDRAALAAVVDVADLVSLSFVRSVADLDDLREELRRHGRPELPIGIKVEHARAVELLPHLLLAGLHGPPMTVMLARGDLAIEIGFERLAEVQEDVLCLCEAAHVPVIWATQVAESMAKQGVPTRAEVTDAASASRAECVMLNKGAHIIDAMHFVDDVFTRMRAHQDKRTPLLHPLTMSDPLTFAPRIPGVHVRDDR